MKKKNRERIIKYSRDQYNRHREKYIQYYIDKSRASKREYYYKKKEDDLEVKVLKSAGYIDFNEL